MPTLDDACRDLQTILATSPNQTVDLVAAAEHYSSLNALANALKLLRSPSSLTIADATLTRGRAQGILSGVAGVTLGGTGAATTPVAAQLTITQTEAETLMFSLALTVLQPQWTFGSAFAVLPQTLRAAAATGPGAQWGPSALRDLKISSPTFTASSVADGKLHLSGMLEPSGDLLLYQDWLGPWPLEIDGTISLPASITDPPLLELFATSRQGVIGVPPAVLRQPGFALISATQGTHAGPFPSTFSELRLVGSAQFGGDSPMVVRLSGTLLISNTICRLTADFDGEGPSLLGGLVQLGALFGLDAEDLRTPPALSGFESFRLDQVEVWLTRDGETAVPTGVTSLAVTIRSNKIWEPPIPFLKVTNVGTRWLLARPVWAGQTHNFLSGSVFGSLLFDNGPDLKQGIVDLTALLPSYVLTGKQRADTRINVAAAFRQLLGRSGPSLPSDPAIVDLSLTADPFGQLFEASATLELELPVPLLTNVSLTQISFEVSASASSLSGGLEGRLRLGPAGSPELFARAELPARDDGGWIFSGGLVPGVPLSFGQLLAVVGIDVSELNSLAISRLEGTVDTLGPWSFAGAIGGAWQPTILGTKVNIAAGMELELIQTGTSGKQPATGWIAGQLAINRLQVRARRDLGVAEPTYSLRVQFASLWIQAATAWVDGADKSRHQVVAIQLGGVTLGDVLEELVNLAAPTLGFELESPWDVLKRIELSRFTLTVDPTDRLVDLTYDVGGQDLFVMRVDKIGVRYTLADSGSVELLVWGKFLDKDFGAEPLKWDVVKDPPPAVPGKGPKLLEVKYVGLGQRVRLPDPQPETLADAIAVLRQEMTEPAAGSDPLAGSAMLFDSSSEWLIAADLRILDTVEVAFIFNDPRLYGLFVALDGEKAGALSGLRFEILYKRLASGVGMFRVELRVPEKFRRIELGAVSIGLGVIVVEIYTNGDFLVDFGFPHLRNYARSFDVQLFPFIGRGGIYFGVLSGGTSRRVPAISNGTFSPVIELGIGMAVGVGKEVSAGPLSGGAFVELEVIFEGVLAWFHAEADGHATSMFYRAQGIVAIHGKVYASVDFYVVKASVNLEAYAQVTVTFESHKATLFRLDVHVEAEAEIEILFVTASFSFSVDLDLSFTVGSDEPTPWIVSAAQPSRLSMRRTAHRLTALQYARAMQVAAAATGGETWTWQEDFKAFDNPRTIELSILPAFTIQHPSLSWTATAPPSPATPTWKVAFPLFAANGISPNARTARAARALAHTSVDPLPAVSIVEALLRWSLSGLPGDADVSEAGKVTAGELALLGQELAKDYVARTQFTRDRLASFFKTNLNLRISGAGTAQDPAGAMAFPAPPWLTIAIDPGGSHDLFTTNPVGPAYAAGATAYMAGFAPVASSTGDPEPDVPAQYQSFAARIFCDWCLIVAREAVRQAVVSLLDTTVTMQAAGGLPPVTLDSTASTLPRDSVKHRVRPGETISSLADTLGAGIGELEALNPGIAAKLAAALPGDFLQITVGVAGCTLAADNATLPLAPGITVVIGDVRIQVRSQDTLDSISKRLYPAAEAAKLVTDGALAGDRRLLRSGAAVTLGQRPNPMTGPLNADLLAGTMYVRSFAPTDVPHADWYAQAIAGADSNQSVLRALGPGVPLPVGAQLAVPTAYAGPVTGSYTTQVGDTLLRVGAALSLAQAPLAYPNQAWADFLAKVLANAGNSVPDTTFPVLPGESLELLAARLMFADGVSALIPLLEAQPVLDPLAVIRLQTLSLSTTDAKTLADMAQTVGLTIEELGRRPEITGADGLFATDTELRVRHLPAQTVDGLVKAVCGEAGLSAVSTQVSRTLLGGIRLPAPKTDPVTHKVTATGALTGVLELAGQQFGAPAPNTTGLTVTVSPSTTVQDWITFADEPGGAPVAELKFAYTGAQLADLYPANALARLPKLGPKAIEVAGKVPRTYGLDQRVELQVARALAIPGAAPDRPAGLATLWPFPAALLTKARAGSATLFDLLRAGIDGESPAHHDVIADCTFGSLIGLTIRRVAGYDHVYDLVGADPGDRLLLHDLADTIAAESGKVRTQLSLAMAPAPGAGTEPTGLIVFDASPTATFVLRANMATQLPLTKPPAMVSASLAEAEAAAFVHLLWEASLAGSGYHFGFATTDGTDLPVGSFAEDGTARLWLIAIGPDAQKPSTGGRTLRSTDTCALVAAGIDTSAHLYIEAHGIEAHPSPYPDELVTQALVPAGSVGVTLTVPRALPPKPDDDDATQAADRLAQLFSMLVMKISGDAFTADLIGPPAPPQREDGAHTPRWVRERQRRATRMDARASVHVPVPPDPVPVKLWRYDQVVPLYQYATTASPMPGLDGLPLPKNDPYRGFGTGTAKAKATFLLGYADVFGNVTEEPFGESVDVDAGYTDPLLGPAAWPAATSAFAVTATGGAAILSVTVTAQSANAVAGPLDDPEIAAKSAARQAERYGAIVFQLAQPTVKGKLLTSLYCTKPDGDKPGVPIEVTLTEGLAPLWRFASAAYLTMAGSATLVQAPVTGLATLADVSARYGLPLGALGAANAQTPFARLAAADQPVAVTARVTVTEGDSAQTILASIPQGWPAPPTPADLLELVANAALPLRPGTVLPLKQAIPLSLGATAPTLTLSAVAARNHTTAAQLAIDSQCLAVLSTGFAFSAGGQTVTVNGTDIQSFYDVCTKFTELAIDVALSELAGAAADRTGLFAANATLSQANFVAGKADTLSSVTGANLGSLAAAAGSQENLWPAGTQVTLGGTFTTPPLVPEGLESLGQFAARHGSTPQLVLQDNGALRLAAAPDFVLPGIAVLSEPDPERPLHVPYTIVAADTIVVLAGLFATTPAAIATTNAEMPGLLVAKCPVSVTIDGKTASTSTVVGDTLATLTARLQESVKAVDLNAVAEAIASDATILAAGALLVMPAAQLAVRGSTQPAALMIGDVAAAYSVDGLAFAQANAPLSDLLAPGAVLTAPTGEQVTTAQADSLNAVLSRFAANGVKIDMQALLATNARVPLFTAGTRALLPPAPATVSAPIGDGTGPFPKPVFPLVVILRLQRDDELVLIKTPEVARADTVVPPPGAPDAKASETLNAFVTAFEAALPGLRLGTARVPGESADLWAVDFTANGIASVTVAPTVKYKEGDPQRYPRFLALSPLYAALQSRSGIAVPVLDAHGAASGANTLTDVQGIDVEVWARRLLVDLDLFLSAPYATGMYRNPASRVALDRLLRAKWTLSGAVARGLAPVLAIADDGAASGRMTAIADLARACGASLAAAYDVAAVVQYDATVAMPHLQPARMIGGAQPPMGAPARDQDFTLTTGATRLDVASSYVSFAMTLPDPSQPKVVETGPLEYAYDAIEFDIDDTIDAADGNESSNWLHLIRPLVGGEPPAKIVGSLGSPRVPVPLRAHPPVPLMLGQSAGPTYTGAAPPTLAQAAQWTFGLLYSHQHAEQDEILLAVTFNIRRSLLERFAAKLDLAAPLAKYALLGDRLRALMTAYLDAADPRQEVRDAVATTVADLVGDVAAAWDSHWPAQQIVTAAMPQTEVAEGDTHHFRIALTGGSTLTALHLSLDGDTKSPGPNGWPTVQVRGPDGTLLPLTGTPQGDRLCLYTPASPIALTGWPAIRLEWPGLNVASTGNGQAALSARRNEHLLEDVPTNAAFVLSSATVTAPDIATPLLEWTTEFSLSGTTLEGALMSAFENLFGAASGPPITIGLGYSYLLVARPPASPGSGLTSFLPVALHPGQALSPAIASVIDQAATAWQTANSPATTGGAWTMSLTLSSWLDPATSRPLLVLHRLAQPLTKRSAAFRARQITVKNDSGSVFHWRVNYDDGESDLTGYISIGQQNDIDLTTCNGLAVGQECWPLIEPSGGRNHECGDNVQFDPFGGIAVYRITGGVDNLSCELLTDASVVALS